MLGCCCTLAQMGFPDTDSPIELMRFLWAVVPGWCCATSSIGVVVVFFATRHLCRRAMSRAQRVFPVELINENDGSISCGHSEPEDARSSLNAQKEDRRGDSPEAPARN